MAALPSSFEGIESSQEPLDPEVKLVKLRSLDTAPEGPTLSHDYHYNDLYVDQSEIRSVVPEPIIIRGVGGTTLFGLNNRFDSTFPSCLIGKVAPEEFHSTMCGLNAILSKSIPFNLKCLMCGCLCCCCTLGLSLGPVLFLSKRTKSRLTKYIEGENCRLYSKLGLNLKLQRQQCYNSNLREYVLLVEFVPKLSMFAPD